MALVSDGGPSARNCAGVNSVKAAHVRREVPDRIACHRGHEVAYLAGRRVVLRGVAAVVGALEQHLLADFDTERDALGRGSVDCRARLVGRAVRLVLLRPVREQAVQHRAGRGTRGGRRGRALCGTLRHDRVGLVATFDRDNGVVHRKVDGGEVDEGQRAAFLRRHGCVGDGRRGCACGHRIEVGDYVGVGRADRDERQGYDQDDGVTHAGRRKCGWCL